MSKNNSVQFLSNDISNAAFIQDNFDFSGKAPIKMSDNAIKSWTFLKFKLLAVACLHGLPSAVDRDLVEIQSRQDIPIQPRQNIPIQPRQQVTIEIF